MLLKWGAGRSRLIETSCGSSAPEIFGLCTGRAWRAEAFPPTQTPDSGLPSPEPSDARDQRGTHHPPAGRLLPITSPLTWLLLPSEGLEEEARETALPILPRPSIHPALASGDPMAQAHWGCCPWLVLLCGMCILVPPSHAGRAGPAGEQLWPLPSGLRKGWSEGWGPGLSLSLLVLLSVLRKRNPRASPQGP